MDRFIQKRMIIGDSGNPENYDKRVFKRKKQMRFLFIKSLFHVIEDIGFNDNKIEAAEKKWGILPSVLKDYYKQLGQHDRINKSQNYLCEPNSLYESGDYVIFYIENQRAAEWGIKKEDLGKEDPPVYCRMSGDEYILETDTLEQAEKVRGKYKKLPFELHQWCEMSFYANNEDEVIMLMVNDDYDLLYGSDDAKHYEQIQEFIETIEKDKY
nr:hypothetical protein [uncultured Aminipila sp.]